FDGFWGRARGKADATALIGCRVRDGHIIELGAWEQTVGVVESSPPVAATEWAMAHAFSRYGAESAYMDPAKAWRSHVNAWEAKYGNRVKVKVKRDHPFEWWMTGGRSHLNQRAIEQFEGAVRNQDMTHDGSFALTQHILNARRRVRNQKLTLAKEH